MESTCTVEGSAGGWGGFNVLPILKKSPPQFQSLEYLSRAGDFFGPQAAHYLSLIAFLECDTKTTLVIN